jgi:hypothetical protein
MSQMRAAMCLRHACRTINITQQQIHAREQCVSALTICIEKRAEKRGK